MENTKEYICSPITHRFDRSSCEFTFLPKQLQAPEEFTSHQLKVIKKEIMNPTEDDSLCRAIRENEVGPITHLWMVAYPWSDTTGFRPHKTLSAEEFRSAYRRRLDIVDPYLGALSASGQVTCGYCKKSIDATSSLHLSDCTTNGRGLTPRHHALRDELVNIANWAGKTTIRDGAYRPVGFKHKQPDLTILEWQAKLDLWIDVRVTSAHKTPLFPCLIQVPNGRTHSDPALHTLSPAHHARISKHHEYVQSPLGEADLDGGNNDKTPEEQRTLKQIILSDIKGMLSFSQQPLLLVVVSPLISPPFSNHLLQSLYGTERSWTAIHCSFS